MTNPCVRIAKIPTTDKHRKSFGHKHDLETQHRKMIAPDILFSASTIETFHFDEEKIGKIIINVTGLKRGIFKGKIPFHMVEMDLTKEWIEYITNSCGVEEEGVKRLSLSDLERPGIILSWDPMNAHTTQIDGSHRMVRRWREGIKTMISAMVFSLDCVNHMARPGNEENLFREEIANERL